MKNGIGPGRERRTEDLNQREKWGSRKIKWKPKFLRTSHCHCKLVSILNDNIICGLS